jgi:hypothetical protein
LVGDACQVFATSQQNGDIDAARKLLAQALSERHKGQTIVTLCHTMTGAKSSNPTVLKPVVASAPDRRA